MPRSPQPDLSGAPLTRLDLYMPYITFYSRNLADTCPEKLYYFGISTQYPFKQLDIY